GCEGFEGEGELEEVGRGVLVVRGERLEALGQGSYILLAIQDVTERRPAAEVRYRRVFETAKDGILIADAETGQIGDANAAAVELLSYSRPELVLLSPRFTG